MGTFEYFDHVADVGIRIEAASLPDLFCTAGRALMEWMGPAPLVSPELKEDVLLEAEGFEELLVRWLQELLFLFHHEHAYFEDVLRMEITDRRIDASVTSRRWDARAARGFQEVKAVTYHQVRVTRLDTGWQASVILDI